MGYPDIILIGIGLAMDCFAVAICYGMTCAKPRWSRVLRMAAFFGGFQGLMPVVGWLAGISLKSSIAAIDHWIAFGLLGFIGIKMVVEALRHKEEDDNGVRYEQLRVLISLSIATSIDALIVGLGFAFLEVHILGAVLIIGLISALFTVIGIFIGKNVGKFLRKKAEIVGGVVLLGIGLKILLEHLLI